MNLNKKTNLKSKLLSQGGFGCIYYPGLKCNGKPQNNKNVVSKLQKKDDSSDNEIKIGYTFFSRDCWGKGINKQVKTLMLNYAFIYIEKVIFHIGAKNIRSQIAIQKLGAKKVSEEMVAYYNEPDRLNFVYEMMR